MQRRDITWLVSGLILLGLLILGLILLLQRVQRQKRLISTQSGQLETMMKELHHRVKNNLQIVTSLLSLQGYRLQDQEAQEAIRLSQQRVQAMSFIHQRLYTSQESKFVNMEEYLTDLAVSLMTAYGFYRDTLDLQIHVTAKWLDVDKALPMGLIANEIITNALKYAYTEIENPALHIELATAPDSLLLTIRDNGIALNEKEWSATGGSFGKQLIASLCRQLNASQELRVDSGAVFTFTIPRDKAA